MRDRHHSFLSGLTLVPLQYPALFPLFLQVFLAATKEGMVHSTSFAFNITPQTTNTVQRGSIIAHCKLGQPKIANGLQL